MIGVKQWVIEDDGDAISFKWKAKSKDGSNYCKIAYNYGSDLYNMTFKKIGRAPNFVITETATYKDVFFDQLLELFESTTGLATHL